jgi:hypothetical protein
MKSRQQAPRLGDGRAKAIKSIANGTLVAHSDLSAQAITLDEIVIDAKIGGDWRRALAWSSAYQPHWTPGLKAR